MARELSTSYSFLWNHNMGLWFYNCLSSSDRLWKRFEEHQVRVRELKACS